MREFFGLWFGQLGTTTTGLRRSALTAADAMVISPIGQLGRGIDAVAVGVAETGRKRRLAASAERDQFGGVASRNRKGRSCLGEEERARQDVSLPLAAERGARPVLAFEMDRETRSRLKTLLEFIGSKDRPEKTDDVGRLFLVRKPNLAPLLTALSEAGSTWTSQIAGGPDAGTYLPLEDDGRGITPPADSCG